MLPKHLVYFVFVAYATSSIIDDAIEVRATRNDGVYRLPENEVQVLHYRIELSFLETIFETNIFDGATFITFTSLQARNEIKLHANGINISNAELIAQNGTRLTLANQTFVSDNLTDILTVQTEDTLEQDNNYMLLLNYTGELRTTEMYGLYKSTYIDEDGNPRDLITTQFQPTHARKAFPCFDEPSLKAQFQISITHPSQYTAVSNFAGSRQGIANSNYSITTFGETVLMPTYLIAIVISDFTCSESDRIDGNIASYVCSRRETESIRDLALEYTPKLTKALEEFTNITYATSKFTKIHQFAIPDFAAGAMENWGLITYREQYLLWDPQESSNRYKQYVITIIAHELAHFWFGNLVTTHWWSDTFLNEGFATYFEFFTPYEVDPSLETDKQFVIEELQAVLSTDASINSAPLSSPASSPDEIMLRFSLVSYSKGGSIFRMVEHFMGLENFKQGIRHYLTLNQFANSEPTDLWNALDSHVPQLPGQQNLTTVMENWVTRAGYPVLNVSINGQNLTLTQKRFLTSGEPDPNDQWIVPVSYTTASDVNKFQDTSVKLWLTSESESFANVLANASDWVILNNQQIGYFRIDYDDTLLQRIKVALNKPGFDGIHEINRAQLVDDFFNFARYGFRNFSAMLDLYQFLEKETSYYVWYSAFTAFSTMRQKTSNEEILRDLDNHILELAQVAYNSLPFNEAKDNDQIYTHKKVLIIPWACRLGLEDCTSNAIAAFNAYRITDIKPDKNLRATIYCNGLRHSQDTSDWDFLWNAYVTSTLATEQVTILSALGCSRDNTILQNYLAKSINTSAGIRQQDALTVFSSVYSNNPTGVDIALDFLIANYEAISDYYASMNSLANLFTGLTNRFTRQDQIDKFREFTESAELGEALLATANAALSGAIQSVEWTQQFEQQLREYFMPIIAEEEICASGSSMSLAVSLTIFLLLSFSFML